MAGSHGLEDEEERDGADDDGDHDEEQNHTGAFGWVLRGWRSVGHAPLDAE